MRRGWKQLEKEANLENRTEYAVVGGKGKKTCSAVSKVEQNWRSVNIVGLNEIGMLVPSPLSGTLRHHAA